MNTADFYDRSKLKWTEEEARQIRKAYETDEMNIIQIADIHKRTPGCIAAKLKDDGVVVSHTLTRGFEEYKASDLFKEICVEYRLREEERKEKKKEREATLLERVATTSKQEGIATNSNEIALLRKEVGELRHDIKKVLEYMTSLWEFETAEA
jgi:hypothetical protein